MRTQRTPRSNEEALKKGISRIRDIHPDLALKILNEAVLADVVGVQAADVFARSVVGVLNPIPRSKQQYWTQRGYSEEEAAQEVLKRKVQLKKRETKCVSPFSRQYWTSKVNPNTGTNYTALEADFERNRIRPIRKEYWISKGYSEEEAIDLAHQAKLSNDERGAKGSAARSDLEKNIHTDGRTAEHWIVRGHSEEEAQVLVKERQRTFSLKKLVQKHGEVQGRSLWEARQLKWQNTLKAKPLHEQLRINAAKIGKGYTISKAEKQILEELKQLVGEIKTQHALSNGQRFFVYDFAFGKKIVEYNGDYWHCNPQKYTQDYFHQRVKLVAKDIWERDALKVQVAEEQGYNVLTIWESDFKMNPQEVINQCRIFLQQ